MRIANSKTRIANYRSTIGCADSPLPAPRSPLTHAGVTLIELLIVIMIISILAGLILGVASIAGETAREDHTRNVVSRLHTLLMEHYGTYKNRRIVLRQSVSGNPGVEELIDNGIPANQRRRSSLMGQALAEARLYALRELMLMEVPDRWSDVLLAPVPTDPAVSNPQQPLYLLGRTDLSNVYLRRYRGLIGRFNPVRDRTNTGEDITDNQGAECLYMIITLATADGEARSLFGEKTIGDVDGDGAPEFLDGWGNPINFLRWAPGFDSQVQINANKFGNVNPPTIQQTSSLWLTEANADHDPYDLFRVEPAAFRLVPLIYSPGRDEEPGVRLVKPYVAWRLQMPRPSGNMTAGLPRLTPYWRVTDADGISVYLGTTYEGATDNIHNHLLGLR